MRAWYLPMCVSSARPFTSPIAYSQSEPGARIQSSTSIGLPGSRPTVSTPRSVVFGRRPIATSSSSPRDRLARLELDHDLAAVRAHGRRLGALAHVHAVLAQRLLDVLAGERLLAREQAVGGLDQRDLRAEAAPGLGHLHADHAAAEDRQPPGRLLGGGGLPVGPGLGLLEPVDRRHRPGRCRSPPRRRGRRPASRRRPPRGARRRAARAADERDAAVGEPRLHVLVVEVVDDLVAALQHRRDVQVAGRPPRLTPGMRRTSASSSPGRSSAFDGMHA